MVADKIPGSISLRVTSRIVEETLAPDINVASSSEGSMLLKTPTTMRKTEDASLNPSTNPIPTIP
jgi:hypothetical protein